MSVEVSIDSLPNEILVDVFSHLPLNTLGKICTVSTKWNSVACINEFWKEYFEKFYGNIPKPENISLKKIVLYHCQRDFIFIIDKSNSMNENDRNNKSRWDVVAESAHAIIPQLLERIQFFQPIKGIDLYFFSRAHEYFYISNQEKLMKAFAGSYTGDYTNLTDVLHHIFERYFSEKDHPRQTSIILLTDGFPNDPESTKKVMSKASSKLKDANEIKFTVVDVVDKDDFKECLRFKYLFEDMDNHVEFPLDIVGRDDVAGEGGLTQSLLKMLRLPKMQNESLPG